MALEYITEEEKQDAILEEIIAVENRINHLTIGTSSLQNQLDNESSDWLNAPIVDASGIQQRETNYNRIRRQLLGMEEQIKQLEIQKKSLKNITTPENLSSAKIRRDNKLGE